MSAFPSFWLLQSGEADLPVDHNGMIIPSDTDFLNTWEVSQPR